MGPQCTPVASMTTLAQIDQRMLMSPRKGSGSETRFLQSLVMLMTRVSKTLLKGLKCQVTWMQWAMTQTQMDSWAREAEYSSTIKVYNKFEHV